MSTKFTEGNYSKAAEQARVQFLKADQEEIAARSGVTTDAAYFYVNFMDTVFRVSRTTGHTERSVRNGTWEDADDFEPTMSVFDYLCLNRGERVLAGEWMTTEHLGLNTHRNRTFDGGFFKREAAFLDAHKALLPAVFEGLGAKRMSIGDVGYVVSAMGDLSIYFQFWESDDEFPANATILWDKNTLRYLHYETLFYIAGLFYKRLGELLIPLVQTRT